MYSVHYADIVTDTPLTDNKVLSKKKNRDASVFLPLHSSLSASTVEANTRTLS